jgi:putative membrane protein
MDGKAFFLRALLLTPGVALAAFLTPGIHYDDGGGLLLAIILLCVLNAFLKPLLILFSLPFILLSLGLGVILVNAFLLWLVAVVIPTFSVASFGSALLGSLIISITSLLVTVLIGANKPGAKANFRVSINGRTYGNGPQQAPGHDRLPQDRRSRRDDDVIDI